MTAARVPAVNVMIVVLSLAGWLFGCAAPAYLSVPPADVTWPDQRLTPSQPAQAIIRDQHLGQLRADARYLEEELFRAERQRLDVCRHPEAVQVGSVAYYRCQVRDQIYEQLKDEMSLAKERYLRAVSGSGGSSREHLLSSSRRPASLPPVSTP
jgi:hypothetical protein